MIQVDSSKMLNFHGKNVTILKGKHANHTQSSSLHVKTEKLNYTSPARDILDICKQKLRTLQGTK